MKAKRSLFDEVNGNVKGITTTTPVLNKSVVKQRTRNTTLQSPGIPIEFDIWQREDEVSSIYWKIAGTMVGEVLVGSTTKGICFLGFTNGDHTFARADLQRRFPGNTLREENVEWLDHAIEHLNNPVLNLPVRLHLKGTSFQLNIWKKLMRIPFGGLTTYGELGNSPQHARATGAAVGANPVSYILPCHRVVRSDGSYHKYFWGTEVKSKLLAYESSNCFNLTPDPLSD